MNNRHTWCVNHLNPQDCDCCHFFQDHSGGHNTLLVTPLTLSIEILFWSYFKINHREQLVKFGLCFILVIFRWHSWVLRVMNTLIKTYGYLHAGAAERTSLENWSRGNSTGGSNPPLSATIQSLTNKSFNDPHHS